MSYEIKGKIIKVENEQEFNSGFKKREFVLETEGQYPQQIKLEFTKDKCDLLNKYGVGSIVTVGFNLRGNEYNGKYFVNLQAWKIEGENFNEISQGNEQQNQQEQGTDGLPF
jgi:hypothetical protein